MLKATRGRVIVPDILFSHPSTSFVDLAKMMAKTMSLFVVRYSDYQPSIEDSIVISLGVPSRVFSAKQLLKINKEAKLIYWMDDCTWYTEERRKEFADVVDRADLVITPNLTKFNLLWPDKQAFHFPFFATEDFLKGSYNDSPIQKCLLSGRTRIGKNNNAYPMRRMICDACHPIVDVLQHPGDSENALVGKDYAKKLNSYLCCVTDGSRCYDDFARSVDGTERSEEYLCEIFHDLELAKTSGQVVKKYYEIPAVGSLLLAEVTSEYEMSELGFIPFENFVPVTMENVFEMIERATKDIEWSNRIRKNGWQLVRDHHTLQNRRLEFRKLIELIN